MSPYESEKLLAEYLLFHYGSEEAIFGQLPGPREALNFPVRCVDDLIDADALPTGSRALDIGCAVGRSSFELGRFCDDILGIDFSHAFIQAAGLLKEQGLLSFEATAEGDIRRLVQARVSPGLDRQRVHFRVGDAMNLPEDVGTFDLVLAANLLCRLADPERFLSRLPELVRRGGQLLVTTPFTWLEEFTSRGKWLGGRREEGTRSFEALKEILDWHFELQLTRDLPFLIREHERKFQYGIAIGCRWVRR